MVKYLHSIQNCTLLRQALKRLKQPMFGAADHEYVICFSKRRYVFQKLSKCQFFRYIATRPDFIFFVVLNRLAAVFSVLGSSIPFPKLSNIKCCILIVSFQKAIARQNRTVFLAATNKQKKDGENNTSFVGKINEI